MSVEKDPLKWREKCANLMKLSGVGKDMCPGRGLYLVARETRDEFLSEAAKIIAPDQAKEQKQTGVIIAIGARRENAMGSPVDYVFDVGDKVLFNQFAGKPLNMHGLELVLLDEVEVKLRLNRNGLGA
jgi:co-chaperonin GroES (HSP10)